MGTVTGNDVANSYNGNTYKWRVKMTYGAASATSPTIYQVPLTNLLIDVVGNNTTLKFSKGNTIYYLTATNVGTIASKTSGLPSSDKQVHSNTNWTLISSIAANFPRYTYTYTGTITWKVKQLSASTWSGTSSVSYSITVPAKPSYAVTFNANAPAGTAVSNMPANQTKWYGDNLTISSTIPTIPGYIFNGWATSATGAATYRTGANHDGNITYSGNAALPLYAVWTPITYQVAYNANGGSGTMAPCSGNLTAWNYGQTYALRTNTFTRTDYRFMGWARTPNGAKTYNDGESVSNLTPTNNEVITLYAIWQYLYEKAILNDVQAYRVSSSSDSIENPTGTYIFLKTNITNAKYDGAEIPTGLKITYTIDNGTATTVYSNRINSSGLISYHLSPTLQPTSTCTIVIQAIGYRNNSWQEVATGSGTRSTVIPKAEFIMDISGTYNSIGIFTTAEDSTSYDNVLQIGGDVCLELDNNAGSGDDFNLRTIIDQLGWLNDVKIL